jgi:23S rRNA (guanosine2251-2'-O)-methyltransferase
METLFRLNPVLEILHTHPQRVVKIFLVNQLTNSRLKQVFRLAREQDVPVALVPRKKLDKLHPHHQGVVAWLTPKPYADLAEVLERTKCPFLVVLDNIEDPQNLGAILRSADGGGVDAVVIPARRAVGLTESVAAVSAGAWEHIPLCREKNLGRTLAWLKEQGIWVVGAEVGAAQLWYEFDYTQPVAVILGSEGRGLRPMIRRQCDVLLALPLRGRVTSLNVAATAAVFIYEVVRQRGQKESGSLNKNRPRTVNTKKDVTNESGGRGHNRTATREKNG